MFQRNKTLFSIRQVLGALGLFVVLLFASSCSTPPPATGQAQPITVIESPPSNSEYQVGQTVAVQSTSTSSSGIARVELLVDGAVVKTDTPPAPQASYTVILSWQATEGQHTLGVRSYNTANQASNQAAIIVNVTPSALATATAVPSSVAIPTAVPLQTATPPPQSPTPVTAPSLTPTPVPTTAPPAAPTIACDSASYVADVTIPDNTMLAPGQGFNKIWRLRNDGSCTWGPGYTFTHVAGTTLAGPQSVGVPPTAPGATADLVVPMTAPTVPGNYISFWRMVSPSGQPFGITVWVKINVVSPVAPAPTLAPTVAPTPAATCSGTPNIASFTASPTTITAGQSATLSWGFVSNADYATIDNGIGGVATPGSATVSPTTTTTYTMTAACGANVTTARVTITVSGAACSGLPAIASFTASPATISPGQSTTLSWGVVSNADSAEIDNGIGGVATPGSITVSPTSTTTYTLTGHCGTNSASAQVTIYLTSR